MTSEREPTVYDVAADLGRAGPGPDARVWRVIDVRGFSSRFTSDLAVLDGADRYGAVLGGLADAQLNEVAAGIVSVGVDDAAARSAGLACGGSARILVQPNAAIPDEFWTLMRDGQPALLLTSLGSESGSTELVAEDGIEAADAAHPGVARTFRRLSTGAQVLDDDFLASAYWPTPRLVVIGDGALAEALLRLAGLLDWHASIQLDRTGLAELGPSDALVILSHDRGVDIPALQAALSGRVGYIGGLGSRRTQANRAAGLADIGVDPGQRIHGPAGLDIGAYTPYEIAISIVAEIMAVRAGASPAPLSERSGPVHT